MMVSVTDLGHGAPVCGFHTRPFILLTVLKRSSPAGVSLTLCCFVVYSTRRFVLVLPDVILFLCFSVL